ncbi:CRISPR-associated endonuclease Cas2 [Streptomyces sp. NPDC007856]|uniref:CRISPR-associated endonuclease Cas2 n=1 Tax=Streptomyces sp. NPDC007856 TaxID=3364781 RepID=UPI00367C018C
MTPCPNDAPATSSSSPTTSPTTTARQDVSDVLSGHGPRVQYSVFEVALSSKAATTRLRSALKKLIDPDEDQIRIYPLSVPDLNEITILGNRRLEERADFWIV